MIKRSAIEAGDQDLLNRIERLSPAGLSFSTYKEKTLEALEKAGGNRQKAAASLSVKAVDLIREHASCLSFIANLDELAQKLGTLDTVPPVLQNAGLQDD